MNYHFKWAPITLTPRRSASQAQNSKITNLLNSGVPSSIISHHSLGRLTFLWSLAFSTEWSCCILFFFPFFNILDQSSHAYIQPHFHLMIIIFEIRFIVRVGTKVICSCMQRHMKLIIPPLINDFPNKFITMKIPMMLY